MESKLAFVKAAQSSGMPFSQLCRQYGVSRKSGYALLKRVSELGMSGLENRSRKPNTSPSETPPDIVALILVQRAKHPRWGGRKIRECLLRQGYHHMPSEKTMNRILSKHGCINPEERAKHKPFIRFEHEHPNDLWQMDFKGHFQVGMQRCHPLTLLDDHSRFSLAIISCADERKSTVISALIKLFRTYGMPKRMTMDNGAPWGYASSQRYTSLVLWLMRLGVKVSHSRPYHPQTQGKLERFHRTLKLELLSTYYFDDLTHAQQGFDGWRTMYNEERPHEGIGMAVPKDRYKPSERAYPEELPPIEYPSTMDTRKVDTSARISYKSKVYKMGKGLIGQPVGIKQHDSNEHLLDVYYCKQKVLTLQKIMSD